MSSVSQFGIISYEKNSLIKKHIPIHDRILSVGFNLLVDNVHHRHYRTGDFIILAVS